MKSCFLIIFVIALVSGSLLAQTTKVISPPTADKVVTGQSAVETANATIAAHGGEKLKKLNSFLAKGTVDLNFMGQAMPGYFSTAVDGFKYHFELNTPFRVMKQVFDGDITSSSFPGVTTPPITEMGFFVLRRIGDEGYTISEVVDPKKKRKGFRITTPEGIITDFFVNEKTRLIKGYESLYEDVSRKFTTGAEIDEFQLVDGVMIPKKYSQRFDFGQMTGYASYNAKSILVNPTMAKDAFALPM